MARILVIQEYEPSGQPATVLTTRTIAELVAFLGGAIVPSPSPSPAPGPGPAVHPTGPHDLYNPAADAWVDFDALNAEFGFVPPNYDEEQPWIEGRYGSLDDLREKFRLKAEP